MRRRTRNGGSTTRRWCRKWTRASKKCADMNPSDLVLVAILKDKRDLEIARVLGWYRIPLKNAPKTVAVDYLAFYQTAKFGDEKWSINYMAPVRGHELTTRAQL